MVLPLPNPLEPQPATGRDMGRTASPAEGTAVREFAGAMCCLGNTLPAPGAPLTPSHRADPSAHVPSCQGGGARERTPAITDLLLREPFPDTQTSSLRPAPHPSGEISPQAPYWTTFHTLT